MDCSIHCGNVAKPVVKAAEQVHIEFIMLAAAIIHGKCIPRFMDKENMNKEKPMVWTAISLCHRFFILSLPVFFLISILPFESY